MTTGTDGQPLFAVGLLPWGQVIEFQGGDASRTPLERPRRPSVRGAPHLFVGSETEATRAQTAYRVPSCRIARVPNPIAIGEWSVGYRSATRATLGTPSDAEVVAWHGCVDLYQKGVDILVASWRRLVEDEPPTRRGWPPASYRAVPEGLAT